MQADALCKVRPYAYHLTAQIHLEQLRGSMRLDSAESLCLTAGRSEILKQRRLVAERLVVDGNAILIRDQRPLLESKMDLCGRCFADLLADINRRVFFWAGKADSPGPYGKAHFRHYGGESPILLRIPMADLLKAGQPELCRYNSGSPRHRSGKPSRRGSDTFVGLADWTAPASRVVEVTFVGGVALPPSTEWGASPLGSWHHLSHVPTARA